jgi:hypothetical protein
MIKKAAAVGLKGTKNLLVHNHITRLLAVSQPRRRQDMGD